MKINNVKKNNGWYNGTVVMTEEVFINDVAVIEGKDGLFFEMPHDRYQAGEEWKKAYHAVPTSAEARAEIMAAVQEAVDNDKMRAVTFEKRPALKGFVSIKAKNVSIKVSYNPETGRVSTPYRKYEKDGETKYANYIGISKEQADAIAEAFKAEITTA